MPEFARPLHRLLIGFLGCSLLGLGLGCASTATPVQPWRADHHMHLASPDLCQRIDECARLNTPTAVYAKDAVRVLDEGGVARGVVLSGAYLYGLASLKLDTAAAMRLARLENEFTATEVAKFPDRLVGFLAVDPLQPWAIDEIEHWRGSRILVGLKLHLTANAVDLNNPDHRQQVAAVFQAAARQELPIVAHIGGGTFDSARAEIFIREILPGAGDNPVQVAHAAGGLPISHHAAVLRVFADHIRQDDPRTRHLLFDLSYVPAPEEDAAATAALAVELRRIGMRRLLFGSDFDVLEPAEEMRRLQRLGFSPEEMATLRANCAPWAC